MEFFRKKGEQKGQQESSGASKLFGGMKIKGPKKTNIPPQSQMYLGTSFPSNLDTQTSKEQPIPKSKKQQKQYQHTTQQPQKSTFQLPGLSKNKTPPIKSQTTSQKNQQKNQHKLQSHDKIKQKQQSQINQITQSKPISSQKQIKKLFTNQQNLKQKKQQSINQNSTALQKKKDKNKIQSNPFLNQIKKSASLRSSQEHYEAQTNANTVVVQSKNTKKTDKQGLISEIRQSHIKSIQFILKQKQAKDLIIQMAGNLQSDRRQLSSTTQKQFLCISKQQYQLAEKYQITIQNLQKRVHITQPQIEQQQALLNSKQSEFYNNQYEQLKIQKTHHYQSKAIICKIKLVELQLLQQSNNQKKKKVQFEDNYNTKIEQQNKTILRLLNDIKFQQQQISTLQKKYEQNLAKKKNPLTQQLNENIKIKNKLNEQINQLQKKLKQKKKYFNQIIMKIDQYKKQIKSIQDIYYQQKNKLQDKKNKLYSLESQKLKFNHNLQILQQKKIYQLDLFNQKTQNYQLEAKNIAQMALQMEQNSNNFQQKLQQKKVKVDTFIHNTKDLKNFQTKHKQSQQKIKQLQQKKANLIAQVSRLQQKKSQTKQKIPKLQSQQKSLVSSKNWKAANMKKSQIKQSQQSIQLLTKQIQQCYISQKQLEQQIINKTQQQNTNINQQNEIKKNLAISQFKFDRIKLQQLFQQKQWIDKFNQNNQIQSKYSKLLDQQIQSLTQQIHFIGQQYSLNLSTLPKNKPPPIIPTSIQKSNKQSNNQSNQKQNKIQQIIPQQSNIINQLSNQSVQHQQQSTKLSSKNISEEINIDLHNQIENKEKDIESDSISKNKQSQTQKEDKKSSQNEDNSQKNNQKQHQHQSQNTPHQDDQNIYHQEKQDQKPEYQREQEQEQEEEERGGYVPLALD